jgi:hypothetical protein
MMNTVELDAAQSKWARGRGTKVMYGGVVLLLFGALGCWSTVASANAKADVATTNTVVVAQQMVQLCKDPQVYNKDSDGCQQAVKVATDPTQPVNATRQGTQSAMGK